MLQSGFGASPIKAVYLLTLKYKTMTTKQKMSVLLKFKSVQDNKLAEMQAIKDIKNCLGQKAVAILKNEKAILALSE